MLSVYWNTGAAKEAATRNSWMAVFTWKKKMQNKNKDKCQTLMIVFQTHNMFTDQLFPDSAYLPHQLKTIWAFNPNIAEVVTFKHQMWSMYLIIKKNLYL